MVGNYPEYADLSPTSSSFIWLSVPRPSWKRLYATTDSCVGFLVWWQHSMLREEYPGRNGS